MKNVSFPRRSFSQKKPPLLTRIPLTSSQEQEFSLNKKSSKLQTILSQSLIYNFLSLCKTRQICFWKTRNFPNGSTFLGRFRHQLILCVNRLENRAAFFFSKLSAFFRQSLFSQYFFFLSFLTLPRIIPANFPIPQSCPCPSKKSTISLKTHEIR